MQTIAEKLREEGIKIGEKNMQTLGQQLKKEEKLETAKRMLLDNISIEKVIKYTGLTEKEVKALMN